MSFFIGYHATGTKHRASLQQGLKAVDSAWDPNSGGELGPGFYITKDYATACLYGAGAAQQAEDVEVDVWKVECDADLGSLEHKAVSSDKQFVNIPKEFCFSPVYWLHNANENPPTQIKFNNWCLNKLTITLFKTMTINDAFDAKNSDAN